MTNNQPHKIKKLKRAVIKEELVALTNEFKEAVVLNQLIYWSERVQDADRFLLEEVERERKFSDGSVESKEDILDNLKNGWIYKTAEEMVEEVMITVSKKTMERVFVSLVEKEYISRRRNPKYKWDKTWQYRVNLNKIQSDLMKLGYSLEGYSLLNPHDGVDQEEDQKRESNSRIDTQNLSDVPKRQIDASKGHHDASRRQYDASKRQNDVSMRHHDAAIPEITTEITPEIVKEDNKDLKDQGTIQKIQTNSQLAPYEKPETINPGVAEGLSELENQLIDRSIEKDSLKAIYGERVINLMKIYSFSSYQKFETYVNKLIMANKEAEKENGQPITFLDDLHLHNALHSTFLDVISLDKQGKLTNFESYLFISFKTLFLDYARSKKCESNQEDTIPMEKWA